MCLQDAVAAPLLQAAAVALVPMMLLGSGTLCLLVLLAAELLQVLAVASMYLPVAAQLLLVELLCLLLLQGAWHLQVVAVAIAVAIVPVVDKKALTAALLLCRGLY